MPAILGYFWRLIPGNPILLRVVESGGKRRRDLFIRCGYLGLLVFLVCFNLISGSSEISGSQTSLTALAKTSDTLFRNMSYLQLGLVALLAPIFTAGAITQEKDAQTYDILLCTPLTNAQILLGSLLSRVFFIVALLVSGIPIFSITQVFGGVAIKSIAVSFGIAAVTALVTGAMAMAIATFKVGTRRTIFSFYLLIIIYLVGIYLLDKVDYFHPFTDPQTGNPGGISWFTGIHPFLALRTIFDPEYAPQELGSLPEAFRRWPLSYYFSNPAGFYISFMTVFSLLLILPSTLLMRRMAQSTSSIKLWFLQKLRLARGDRTRKPRAVWSNPIAWREAKTKASAARSAVMRYGFMGLGVAAALVLLILFATTSKPDQYVKASSYRQAAQGGDYLLDIYDSRNDSVETWVLAPGFLANSRYKGGPVEQGDLIQTLAVTNPHKDTQRVLLNGKWQDRKVLKDCSFADVGRALEAGAAKDPKTGQERPGARDWLLGLVVLEFAVILLIVTNAAASAVTREKEDGTLDLLLTTPITSRYYIWGKLRGLVSFVMPLAAVPVFSVLLFVVYDVFRLSSAGPRFQWVVFPEAVLILPGTLVIVTAFAAIVGMQMSLRCRTTVWAVMSSIGIVVGACFGLGLCGYTITNARSSMGTAGAALSCFSPFTLMSLQIDPYRVAQGIFGDSGGGATLAELAPYTSSYSPYRGGGLASDIDIPALRFWMFLFGWAATIAYALVVWTMYKSMVKNFDMTIRRQSR